MTNNDNDNDLLAKIAEEETEEEPGEVWQWSRDPEQIERALEAQVTSGDWPEGQLVDAEGRRAVRAWFFGEDLDPTWVEIISPEGAAWYAHALSPWLSWQEGLPMTPPHPRVAHLT